jgi:hypothetical protein
MIQQLTYSIHEVIPYINWPYFDYAWGVEDWEIPNKKGMFMFSLGTDF